jgi:ABC-type nitrate/sulfonate/bicarbonate transport system ATPase subunit
VLELKGITKGFGELKVLDGLNAVLPDVGLVALRGDSGSGKTTLLRILAGLEKPDGGEITGLDSRRVFFVFQEDRLLPHASALDNAAIACGRATGREWLRRFGLGGAMHKKPAALSGGMRRRVALARAFAAMEHAAVPRPILLLDEPFNGLDNDNIAMLKKEITNAAGDALVILVSHGADIFGDYAAEIVL